MSDTLNRRLAELLEPEPTLKLVSPFSAVWKWLSEKHLWRWVGSDDGYMHAAGREQCSFHEDMNAAAALFEAALPRIAEEFGVTREEVHIDTRPRRDGTWYASFPWQLTHIGRTGKTIPESWRNAIAAALGVSDG